MALLQRAVPEVEIFPARSDAKADNGARGGIEKLASLHDEARETAMLANLLGRTPYAAAALTILALAALGFGAGTMPAAEPATWALLMLIGIGAMLRVWRNAMAQPFERGSLRAFAADLNAIVVYCGFAWGAGAYLALGPQSSWIALTAFAAGPAIAVALSLRTKETVIGFVAPVAALCAFATVLRPLPEGPLGATFVLIACAAVGGAIFWAERFLEPSPMAAKLADFQFS
jgi:hypothetical protein